MHHILEPNVKKKQQHLERSEACSLSDVGFYLRRSAASPLLYFSLPAGQRPELHAGRFSIPTPLL